MKKLAKLKAQGAKRQCRAGQTVKAIHEAIKQAFAWRSELGGELRQCGLLLDREALFFCLRVGAEHLYRFPDNIAAAPKSVAKSEPIIPMRQSFPHVGPRSDGSAGK